jgi:hypothetical protein
MGGRTGVLGGFWVGCGPPCAGNSVEGVHMCTPVEFKVHPRGAPVRWNLRRTLGWNLRCALGARL